VGGTVAAFLSYASTLHADKHPESFGKGNIKGVIAPEAANNSKDGGALIPTLAFGIPGSAEMAVFLGVLILHGIEPGPMLLVEHQGVVFSLILALSASCVIATVMGLAVARQLALITLVDVHLLVPAVIAVSLVGVYALKNDPGDIIVAAAFGAVGYFMIRFGYPRITMVIALVLGELAERSYHQSMMISEGSLSIFATRIVALVLFAATVFILLTPAVKLYIARLRAREAGARKRRAPPPPRVAGVARLLVPALVAGLAVLMLLWAQQYEGRTRTVPELSAGALLVFALLDLIAATGTRPGHFIAALFAGTLEGPAGDDEPHPPRQVLEALAWVAGYLGFVLLAGFHVATPVYVALFIIARGRMTLRRALIAAAATAGFIAVTFEWLMQFELYRGLLFG
jgi:hypothetical protein